MNLLTWILYSNLYMILANAFIYKLDFKDIIFTIISQRNFRHSERAVQLKNEILTQTNSSSTVYISPHDFNHIGHWTILPILPLILERYRRKFSWAFFCTDETNVNTSHLKALLETFDSNVTFVGRALLDKNPTIIHHFYSSSELKYPLFSSGFALHFDLIKKLTYAIIKYDAQMYSIISIDASHELAMFIKTIENGTTLTHSPSFCIENKKNCATYVKNSVICDKPLISDKKIYFAVKTYHKFHKDRVPVVLKTWAKRAQYITFYSDIYDPNIPTVKLDVPNTEYGHCGKTQAIIKDIKKKMDLDKFLEWAVICDDDTILSPYRLQELLSCYNSSDSIAIGERYGCNVRLSYGSGHNYLTGGGGVVLSRSAILKFSEGNCNCPFDSMPDDMYLLGLCLRQLKINIVHIPLFHQARPNDYSDEYLMVGPPISFHKHWMIDPIQVYNEWFHLSDVLSKKNLMHVEL